MASPSTPSAPAQRAAKAVEAVRQKAIDALECGKTYGVASDPHTFGKRGEMHGSVLLAIATFDGSLVLAIDNDEWATSAGSLAETLIRFCGGTEPTAIERASETLAEQAKSRGLRKTS